MFQQEKRAAVTRALEQTFGVTEFEDLCKMTKGTSPFVFRMTVRGRPFLLKLITRTSDPARKIACMRAAAQAGLAPHVWYTSVEDRISITDFVQAVPLPWRDALLRMASTLRALHALPPFPKIHDRINTSCTFLLNEAAAVQPFLHKFQAANIFATDETEELFARYTQIAAVYPRHASDMVSSHNDLFKPDNILFDGNRVWLVDWEAAFLNDRYADLAVVAHMVVSNDDEERVYLHEYFGQAPNEYQLARFFLMRQLSHMFYAMVFLLQGSPDSPPVPPDITPAFEDFQQRFWTGEIDLGDKHMKAVYGRVHWERLSRNMRQARFDEALRIVANHPPSAETSHPLARTE